MTPESSRARNVLSHWLLLAATLSYSLVITPIVVRTLDTERYGIWSFLNGLLTYAELFYLGLGVAFVKYVAHLRAKDDVPGITRLAGVISTLYTIQGLVGFGILAAFGLVVPDALGGAVSEDAYSAAALVCVLLGARVLTMFIASVFSGLLCGHDRFDLANGVYTTIVVARFVATPVLLEDATDPLLAMAWIAAVAGLGEAFALAAVTMRHVKTMAIRLAMPRLDEMRRLYGFGLRTMFVVLAVKLISYTDITVVGVMLGATSVALLSLPLQLVEYARLGIAGLVEVLLPRIETLTTIRDTGALQDEYISTARLACLLSGWLIALLITLGPAFLDRWVGPEYGTPVRWVVTCLALAMFGQVVSTQIPLAFYQALQALTVPTVVLLAEAAVNLALSIVLAPHLGLLGVALATVIPAVCVSMVILPRYLCRLLGISPAAWARTSVLPGVAMLGLSLAAQWILGLLVDTSSYSGIVIRVMGSVPIAVLVAVYFLPRDQVRWMLGRLAAIIESFERA